MCLFNNKRKVYITMNDKREKFASRLGVYTGVGGVCCRTR